VKRIKLMNLTVVAVLALLMDLGSFVSAQDKPASNLEIIHEKLKADKKLIVAKYMELTESEAKKILAGLRRIPERPADE
jgi:hypothetical protein